MAMEKVEALLEQAAQSSKLMGWNDSLQWLVNSTLSRFQAAQELSDESLSLLAAGTRLPQPEEKNTAK